MRALLKILRERCVAEVFRSASMRLPAVAAALGTQERAGPSVYGVFISPPPPFAWPSADGLHVTGALTIMITHIILYLLMPPVFTFKFFH